jgi:hypothetical protein
MARIKELKEKYPFMSLSIVDMLCELDPSKTNKFVPLFLKISESVRKNYLNEINHERGYYIEYLRRYRSKNNKDSVKNLTNEELCDEYLKIDMIRKYIDEVEWSMLHEFIDLYERGIISYDLNKVKTIDDVNNLISLSQISQFKKEDSKNVKVEYRDDDWLLIRPLSFESSLKYGAGTRWCTASKSDPHHFFRYSERGVLVYIISLKTGKKYGHFKELPNIEYKGVEVKDEGSLELSFWNQKDDRIDSLQCGFSGEVYEILRNLENVPNRTFIGEESWKEQQSCFQLMKGSEQINVPELYELLDDEPLMESPSRYMEPEQ